MLLTWNHPLAGLSEPRLNDLQRALWRVLVYFDIFNYPPTTEEIWRYLDIPAGLDEVAAALSSMDGAISRGYGFWALADRRDIIALRLERQDRSRKLWNQARRRLRRLRYVPFLRFAGVSGSLSMNNIEAKDDVDLFFITTPGKSGFVFMMLCFLRHVYEKEFHLCPNFGLEEHHLTLDKKNFFSAHELFQMQPLWNAPVYERFLAANVWAHEHLPNAGSRGLPLFEYEKPSRILFLLRKFLEAIFGGRFNPVVLVLCGLHRLYLRAKLEPCRDPDCFRRAGGVVCGRIHYENHIAKQYQQRLLAQEA